MEDRIDRPRRERDTWKCPAKPIGSSWNPDRIASAKVVKKRDQKLTVTWRR